MPSVIATNVLDRSTKNASITLDNFFTITSSAIHNVKPTVRIAEFHLYLGFVDRPINMLAINLRIGRTLTCLDRVVADDQAGTTGRVNCTVAPHG